MIINTLLPMDSCKLRTVSTDQQLDCLERELLRDLPAVEFKVEHRFTPGLYGREIFMPAGSLLTSKVHKTRHQYAILTGVARVFIDGKGVEELRAPHVGITEPGTRRLLYIVEDCRWITFHPIEADEDGDVDKIEARIIERRELPDGSTNHDLYLEALRTGLVLEEPK